MLKENEPPQPTPAAGPAGPEYWALSRRLFALALEGGPLREFVAEAGGELLRFCGAGEVEFWLHFGDQETRFVCRPGEPPQPQPSGADDALSSLGRAVLLGTPALPVDLLGPRHSLTLVDSRQPLPDVVTATLAIEDHAGGLADAAESLLFLPFHAPGDGLGRGLALLKLPRARLAELDVALLEEVAQGLALAFADRRGHARLRERMKELHCLYQMALIVEQAHSSVDEVLQEVVESLPQAWLHPADARVCLQLGDAHFTAGTGEPVGPQLRADVVVAGQRRGMLEVGYVRGQPPMDDGPFLHEERHLLDTVAREIALILERKEIAEARRRLQEQLQHAERLATVGAVAAGIGHELNDPLNHILGYAQLIEKQRGLPEQMQRDLATITTAALHAREVIRQLLLFARRMPQRRVELELNRFIEQARPFLQVLATGGGSTIVCELTPGLPAVSMDPDQLRQVLVNLVVNAAQAMHAGGRITVSTAAAARAGFLQLVVEDDGPGMSEDAMRNAFVPFYTTRAEGTGLGLPVVHGIVASHGGTIELQSEPGRGTRFEILLPAATAAAGEVP